MQISMKPKMPFPHMQSADPHASSRQNPKNKDIAIDFASFFFADRLQTTHPCIRINENGREKPIQQIGTTKQHNKLAQQTKTSIQ
jgi:hypothetical protein